MSSSNVKRLLRSARECLGRREYREALQQCKEILAEDKACYEAYIYVGKAAFHLQEFTQAEAAYRRASDLDPRNPLAWQGLAELSSETGSWAAAADSYGRLLQLADEAAQDDPLRSRRSTFLRRYAEAASRGGLLAEAEAAWRGLADAAAEAAEAAQAAAGEDDAARAAAAAAEGELLECLCRLADVQLAADAAEIESRVAVRLAAEAEAAGVATQEQLAAMEPGVRSGVEAEWAEEALELDADHASATLRRIIALRPPSPPFAPYYDAFLKRLRKYIQAAPPGSMDRHSRRAVLLAAAKATMDGRCGERTGGCCSPYPYEAALAMLEVEHEVVGAEDPSLDPANLTPSLEPPPLPLMVADCGRISSRLMHRFPWSPTAQMYNALALRRRAATAGFDAPPPAPPAAVARLPAAGGGVGRRRQVTALLLSSLSRGAKAVSGWLASCELLLEGGAAEAALDAAKEGLKYVAHRDLVGKERLAGAALLLRLLAGQALLRLRKLEEAQLLLEGLAHGVSEGHVASGELAAIPPINISQHAKRYLAHVAAAGGDLASCRHQYDELVGGQLMGRSAAHIEAWAHGELGMLLLRQGEVAVEGARFHLQAALTALQPSLEAAAAAATSPSATALVALQQEAATYQLHLALALWVKAGGKLGGSGGGGGGGDGGGEVASLPRQEPFRSECRELLLAAAAVAGPLQAAAFTWLGHWYGKAAEPTDDVRARRCFQRALALDPTQAEAGEALVAALRAAGRADTARQLCEEMQARAVAAVAATAAVQEPPGAPSAFLVYPGLLPAAAAAAAGGGGGSGSGGIGGAGWALRALARLQRDVGSSEEAVTSYQSAIRLEPEDAELWEGLAASYQALGRHTAALKSYDRALALSPGRLFSRLQAAALHYQMGVMPDALSYYRTALAASPANAAALLGCGEVLLAQAALAARMGAAGGAAAELAEAAALAASATRLYGNLQAGWKLLGDVRMQHAAVPTLESVAATRGSPQQPPTPTPSPTPTATPAVPVVATLGPAAVAVAAAPAVSAGLAAARERLAALRAARRSYAAAVHLDPRVAGLWGDLGLSYHLQLELAGQHPQLAREAELQRESPSALRRRALSLARGGLRLDPSSDQLWACAGTIAAAAAAAPAPTPAPASAPPSNAAAAGMAATAEFCYCRALQLNPRRAPVWAALGRMYAAHGEGGLASRCFDAARSHEPTSVAVWEAMGDAALRRGGGGGGGGLLGWRLLGGGGGGGDGSTDPRVSAAWRDAADAFEHAQLLGGDVESRLGFVLGRLLQGDEAAPADGSLLAAASKAAAMHPLLPAAHQARALALEARGDHAAAVEALKAALELLDSEGAAVAAGAVASAAAAADLGPSSRPLVAPFDPRVAATPRAAIQLDLARALTAAGRAAEAVALYERLRQEGVVRQEDYGARLSYGMALLQANRTAEAVTLLSELAAGSAAPLKLRLAAATSVVRIHVAARRWDEAYGVVLAATADVPDEGPAAVASAASVHGAAAETAARLWLILLAGMISARAPELEAELLAAVRQWAAARRDLDTAGLECRIQELITAKHRAAGAHALALRQAARAVHACPSDRGARALLAHAALAAGPRHTPLAARAAPRGRPPFFAAAAGENAVPDLSAAPPAAPLAPSATAAHAAGVIVSAAAAAAYGGGGAPAALLAAVREAAARMRAAVHAHPNRAAAWHLCALTELQHAIASGGHARLYRSAAAAATAAAARSRAELQDLPLEPAPQPPRPGPPGFAPPGLPPVLAMAMAAQAARAHATVSDPRVAALRSQRTALADVLVQSLAVLSECRLQLRDRGQGDRSPRQGVVAQRPTGQALEDGGGGGSAAAAADAAVAKSREAAEEALRAAEKYGVDATSGHLQMARLHVALGDLTTAEAAYEQAARMAASAAPLATTAAAAGGTNSASYEFLPVLEWAAVRAASGRQQDAIQQLEAAAAAAAGAPAGASKALADVAAVQRALLLLQLGAVEAAREAAAVASSGHLPYNASLVEPPSVGLRAAAQAVQAAAALLQSSLAEAEDADGGGAAARKKALLEARWAAREALKPLAVARPAGAIGRLRPSAAIAAAAAPAPPAAAAGPAAALASLLLGLAEAGLGKEEAAREQIEQVSRHWPRAAADPPEAVVVTVTVGAAPPSSSSNIGDSRGRSHVVHAVHCRPWALGPEWSRMVAAVRAA